MSNPIYGGTAGCCLYWIDKNENKDTPTVSAGATFNVDNPSFWTNLSVLSGLASGYCERLAVAKLASAGTAITAGAKAELVTGNTWTMGPTVTADVTSNGEIASKVMNGFALGKTDANLFTTSQATFRTVGTSLGSNYMRSVDSAIISMCDIPGGYVQGANNTNAYTFSDLATAAKARSEIESVAGSAVDKPTANGGVLARTGALAYPVAWAKQRKWMLDELRYTGAPAVTIDPISIIGDVYEYSTRPTIAAGHTNVNDYYTIYLTGATLSTQNATWGGVTGTVDSAPVASVFMRAGAAQIATTQNATSITQCETEPWLVNNASHAILTRPTNGLYMTRAATVAETGLVKLDLTQAPPLSKAATEPRCVYNGETSTFDATTNDLVYVFSGGTAIFQDNKTNINGYHAVIFSGGYASAEAIGANNLNKAARFNDLCILTGGTFTGPKAANILHAKGFYADPNCSPNDTQIYVVDGVSSNVNTNAANSSFFLVNGGTLSLPPGGTVNVVYVGVGCTLSAGSSAVNGHTAQNVGANVAKINYLMLDSGGYAYLGHATRDIGRTTVMQGATLYADVYQDKLTSDAYFDSDCIVTINYLTGTDPGTMPFTENAQVTMGYGGMTDMVNGATTTTYPKITINVYRSTDDVNNALARSVDLHVFDPMGLHSSGGQLVTEGLNTLPAVFAQGSTAACVITVEGSTAATNLLQQPPTSNTATYRLIGTNGYYVHYNCAVGAVYATPSGTGIINHYQDFRVRQWSEDPAAT